jgi:hypothetical protein
MRVVHKGSLEVERETEQKWPETPQGASSEAICTVLSPLQLR